MAGFEEKTMNRTAKDWAAFNPVDVVWPTRESPLKAFRDAQADILKMAEVLRFIGYPVPGEPDSVESCCAATEYVRANFTLRELDKNV